jgi:hypothetical protein
MNLDQLKARYSSFDLRLYQIASLSTVFGLRPDAAALVAISA